MTKTPTITVAYRVMMGENAAHSSMPLNVSNEHSPAAARPVLVASIFGLSVNQMGVRPPLLLHLHNHALRPLPQRLQAPGILNSRHVHPYVIIRIHHTYGSMASHLPTQDLM